jgi:hypothetical protein
MSINTILYVVNTNIYQYLRVQDGKNLQYTCNDIAQIIAEIRNKPAFKSDPTGCAPFSAEIYTQDAKGNATLYGKPCKAVAGYDVKYHKIGPSKGLFASIMKKLGEPIVEPNVGKYKVYYNTLADPELSPWAYISHTLVIVDSKEEAIAIVSSISKANEQLIATQAQIKAFKKEKYERLNGTKDRPKVSIQGSVTPTNPWCRKPNLV